MSIKLERLEQQLRKEISNIIQFDLKKQSLGFITVTDVKLVSDLSYATIFVSILNVSETNRIQRLNELSKTKGFIKTTLAHKMKMRKIPDLIFKFDDSLDRYQRIDNILNSLEKNDEK